MIKRPLIAVLVCGSFWVSIASAQIGISMFPGPGNGALVPVTFVGASAVNSNGTTITWPSGTQAGDLAIVSFFGSAVAVVSWSGASGPTSLVTSTPANAQVYTKTLTGTDISSPPSYTVPNGSYDVAVYRNGNTITVKNSVSANGTATCTMTGFTKSGTSSGVLSFLISRSTTNAGLTAPSGFTNDSGLLSTTFTTGAFASVPPIGYTDSSNPAWTGITTTFQNGCILFETAY